ncbi:MAG: hypothetical protein NUV74_03100 [Candidatus Brocadiaceae bacterium]|nr:hypothetical protein [Candidatus Brocadiaceae bacterium]
MKDIAEFLPQALSSLNSVLSIFKTIGTVFNQSGDTTNTQESLVEATNVLLEAKSKIISAQEEHSFLSSEIDKLKQECMRLKDWKAESKRYARKQIAPGVFAYIENDFVEHLQDTHKYCCNCFDKTVKSTLQQKTKPIAGYKRVKALVCPNGCPDLELLNYSENIK